MKNKIFISLLATSIFTIVFGVTTFAADKENNQHTVLKGQTLWRISKNYDIKLNKIINANPQIHNPNLIYPGDEVYIPVNKNNGVTGLIGASATSNPNYEFAGNFGSNKNDVTKIESMSYEQEVANIVNRHRLNAGLEPLKLSADISNVARTKSNDMRNKGYFDHNSPTYGDPFAMLNKFGIKYKTAGENIAKGQKTPQTVMIAWMNSEGHKKNIMSPNFKEIGIGYVTDSNGTAYWTQQFINR